VKDKSATKKLVEFLDGISNTLEREGAELQSWEADQKAGHVGGWAPGESFVTYKFDGRRTFSLTVTIYVPEFDQTKEESHGSLSWRPQYPREG